MLACLCVFLIGKQEIWKRTLRLVQPWGGVINRESGNQGTIPKRYKPVESFNTKNTEDTEDMFTERTFDIKILDKTFVLSCFRVRKVGLGYILIS